MGGEGLSPAGGIEIAPELFRLLKQTAPAADWPRLDHPPHPLRRSAAAPQFGGSVIVGQRVDPPHHLRPPPFLGGHAIDAQPAHAAVWKNVEANVCERTAASQFIAKEMTRIGLHLRARQNFEPLLRIAPALDRGGAPIVS